MRPDSTRNSSSNPEGALIPEGWLAIEGLVSGFGDRRAGAPKGTLLLEKQVHGTRVVHATGDALLLAAPADDGFARVAAEADALVSAQPRTVVGVRTADCVPLLLVSPKARWAAAVHAGWRGTLAGIAGEAVKAAAGAGIRADELIAAVGPSIGPCCYEVSPELGEDFVRAGLAQAPSIGPRREDGRPHLDLRAANRLVLERAGVPAGSIQTVGPCTRCARERYHSFRAEPESAGRQVSWIGWS